ncbi:MAG: hypothetical protein J6V13_03730 [Paludibacteraceae bacterium]|nr:hypothetical protein [Paludibacteraceae bacterium]
MTIYDKCIPVEYEKNGEKKTSWKKIGVVFIGDDGKMWGRDECIPLNWDGKYNLFPQSQKEQTEQTEGMPF